MNQDNGIWETRNIILLPVLVNHKYIRLNYINWTVSM